MLLRLLIGVVLGASPAMAGPVVCTTTLEAPDPPEVGLAPVELTVCEPVETTMELVERRLFTWTAPYARGVNMLHQVTDLFGIALAGPSGNRLMGFGFPDQTVIWDASALDNTTHALIEQQSSPMPLRTMDLSNGFDSSLTIEAASEVAPIRTLW